ncbi:MAG: class SAM-dependent methyltransferase [Flavipsychrobacter sp.]|nr:class SAM-dependent methyltransferase [Flavipsychrobacter sp.]
MSQKREKYVHTEDIHNPSMLVPIFYDMFKPASVCDVGCGVGAFLDVFKQLGVKKVLGYDGVWANRELIATHIADDEFQTIDFEKEMPKAPQKFDLVVNLEVAEHISHERSDNLIDFLVSLSDTIIFSAALPDQGGYEHINEQWEEYWEEKFNKRGYKKYDIIRHKICANKDIIWWYRQNTVVYSSKDLSHFPEVKMPNMITQELFMSKIAVNKQLVKRLQSGLLVRMWSKLKKR